MTNQSKYRDVLDPVDPATEALFADLEALHDVDVPAIPLSSPSTSVTKQSPAFLRRHYRPLAVAAAAVVAIAIFLAAPSLSGDGSGTVSAQTILERTQRAAATNAPATSLVRSYHMLAEQVIAGDDGVNKARIRTETWYQDDEHVRSEDISPSTGRVIFGQSRDGGDFWIYGIFDGNTVPASGQGAQRAVHGPAGELSFGKLPVESGGSSLADLLAHLSARDCFNASVTGEEAVASRTAYVIEVRPTSGRCSLKPDAGGVASQGGKPGRDSLTRLWVDKDTFITLRSEFYSAGRLLSSYTVLQFEVDPAFAPGTFAYQPGSRVEVIEVGSLGEAKQALAGLLGGEKPKDGVLEPRGDVSVPPKPAP